MTEGQSSRPAKTVDFFSNSVTFSDFHDQYEPGLMLLKNPMVLIFIHEQQVPLCYTQKLQIKRSYC